MSETNTPETGKNSEKAAEETRVKRVLTKGDSYYLAGLLPFDPEETAKFTPRILRDAPEEDRPVFELVAYTRKQVKDFYTAFGEDGNAVEPAAEALKGAIKGWENLKTAKGKAIPFSPEAIDSFPAALIMDLHTECMAYATGILPEEAEGLQ